MSNIRRVIASLGLIGAAMTVAGAAHAQDFAKTAAARAQLAKSPDPVGDIIANPEMARALSNTAAETRDFNDGIASVADASGMTARSRRTQQAQQAREAAEGRAVEARENYQPPAPIRRQAKKPVGEPVNLLVGTGLDPKASRASKRARAFKL